MDTEEKIREHVRETKRYYTNLVIYGFVSALCFLIWLAAGGGHFWPIWVFLGLGISAVLQGARVGHLKALEEHFSFLKPDWEDEQVKELMKEAENKKAASRGKSKSHD